MGASSQLQKSKRVSKGHQRKTFEIFFEKEAIVCASWSHGERELGSSDRGWLEKARLGLKRNEGSKIRVFDWSDEVDKSHF